MGTPLPTQRTWDAIVKLALDGQDTEKQIDDLEAVRADLKGKLAEMGMSHAATHSAIGQQTLAAFGQTELTLGSLRASLKVLARQSNELVAGAIQGKFADDKSVDEILGTKPGDKLPLYDDAMRSAQAVGVTKPAAESEGEEGGEIGESDEAAAARENAKPDPLGAEVPKTVRTPEAGWRGSPLSEIKRLTKGGLGLLTEAGLVSLGDVDRFLNADKLPLTNIEGLSGREIAVLTGLIVEYRSSERTDSAPGGDDAGSGEKPKRGRGRRAAAAA